MMEISALDVFEELRFIWELLLAEILFAACFTKKREMAAAGGLAGL